MEKFLMAWSGGKDSALALYEFRKYYPGRIVALLSTVTEGYRRVSMHGVREVLLEDQAAALGCRLEKVFISQNSTDEEYENRMKERLLNFKAEGVHAVIFGDLFLEDIRKYRESNLSKIGMKGIFPLWGRKTESLAREFIEQNFRAVITCVDSQMLDPKFSGRKFDGEFLDDLPPQVDPCGENGEFHTFVYEGPIFGRKVHCSRGEITLRNSRFSYCDLVPGQLVP